VTDRRLSEDHPRDPQANDARLAEIRARHAKATDSDWKIHADREWLLARVDQLTTERDDAKREAEEDRLALINQPVLRHCVYPACLREFDISASMNGRPTRDSWSSKGWLLVTALGGYICPEHASVVAEDAHRPHWLATGKYLVCACGWESPPGRWRGYGVEAWKDHVMPEIKEAPDA
jgi:hypothetical protein